MFSLRNKTRPVTGTGQLAYQGLAHHIKTFDVKSLTFANPDADAWDSTIALPEFLSGELKIIFEISRIPLLIWSSVYNRSTAQVLLFSYLCHPALIHHKEIHFLRNQDLD